MSAAMADFQTANFRLGLLHVTAPPSLRLAAALSDLTPPEACDWSDDAAMVAGIMVADGNARGNDTRGCCVECGALQSVRIRRAVTAGDTRDFGEDEAFALYRAWGWDGTDAGDVGTLSDLAANTWGSKGVHWGQNWLDLPSVRAVDPRYSASVKAAVAFLGPVQVDLALPMAWQSAVTWWAPGAAPDGVPGSWGPHRVCGYGYTRDGLLVVTWGQRRLVTWEALATYGLGCEATVSRSWLKSTGLSPGGLDIAALEAEGRAVAVG